MNITDVLSFLTEERGVDYITKTLSGKVPQETVNALSSRMKKGKFDNEAMAILKGIQDEEGKRLAFTEEGHKSRQERLQYLSSHASMIYSILRKLKTGDSSFNADEIITDYIKAEGSPSAFWKEKYSKANNKPAPLTKEQKRYNTVGLDTARFKDLGDCFAILPKNFKNENGEWGFKDIDIKKSHEELKTLSADMAKRDTSGEPEAQVNHWCVAASDPYYFKNYKSKNGWRKSGNFIIFVKKNEDGSPDWNNRYLTWFNGSGLNEIADKFDKHIGLSALPKGAQKFFVKAFGQSRDKKNNKPDEEEEITRRIESTVDERKITFGKNKAGQKALDYVFELARKGKENQASQIRALLKKELKARYKNSFMDELERLKDWGGIHFYSSMANKRPHISSLKGGKYVFVFEPIMFEGTAEEVLKFLDDCIADPSLIVKKIDEGFARNKKKSVPLITDKFTFGEPTENMIRSLGGNKKVIEKYFITRENVLKERRKGALFIPSTKSFKEGEGIWVYFGDWNDPNLIKVQHHSNWGTSPNQTQSIRQRIHWYHSFHGHLSDNHPDKDPCGG